MRNNVYLRGALRAMILAGVFMLPARARAADVTSAASSLAEELLRGLSVDGDPVASPILVQTFSSPTHAPVALAFTQALRRAATNLGAEVFDPGREEKPATLSAGQAVVYSNAQSAKAKTAIWGQIACGAATCTVTAEGLDVVGHTLLLTSSVVFDTPSGGVGAAVAATSVLGATLRGVAEHLATGLQRVGGETRFQHFAVAPLGEDGAMAKQKHLGLLVALELTRLLRQEHGFNMIDPVDIQRIMDGMHIDATDLDMRRAAEIGQQIGIQGMAVGQINEATGLYLVSLQVLSVRDGEVIAGEEASLPAEDLIKLAAAIKPMPARYDAFLRSLAVPGWGQFYIGHPYHGLVFSISEAAMLGAAIFFQVEGSYNADRYHRIKDPASKEFTTFVNAANHDYKMRNISILALVATHVANVVDALLLTPTD